MIACAENAVSQIESKIAEKLGPQRFNVWFKNATRLSVADSYLHVCAPNPFVCDWIERNFSEVINEAAEEVTGARLALSFATDPELTKRLPKRQSDRQAEFVANNAERIARMARRQGPSPGFTRLRGKLEDFVVGHSNELAYKTAVNVAQSPGSAYRLLFIHGGCGIGKTHLLQGICNSAQEQHPNLRWRYVSGEEFTNDYICSVKAHEEDAFRTRYRSLDLLVIDDVHFFANKRATQEEFLHTLRAIDNAGKQMVLASDAHPKLIGYFSDSLVSRFMAGMVVRIDSPDVQVRANFLRQRAGRLNAEVSDAVIMHIAETFRANIRELEGALLRVVAQAQVTQQSISLALADRALRDLVRQTAPVVLLSDIESIVSIYFGLTPSDLHTSRKSRPIALARSIVMYLARKHTDMSFPEIGRFLGNKNHSTVILACRRISNSLQKGESARWPTPIGQKERDLGELMAELEEQFGNGRALKVG